MRHIRLAFATVLLASLLLPATVAAAPPIAGNDQASTNEDTAVTIDLLANDSDPDGDLLHIQSITQGQEGKVTLTPVAGLVQFAPNPNFNGQARFGYTVADGAGATATALVVVFVSAVNDPPTAWGRVASVAEDDSVEILFGGTDPDKERCDLIFSIESGPDFGTLGPLTDAGCNPNGDMATARYTPYPGFNGQDTLTYTVFDGVVESDIATARITVTPVEDAPVALAGSASTTASAPVSITLRGFDWETCELGFAIASLPAHGSLSAVGVSPCGPGGPVDQHVDSAPVLYTPAPGFGATDTFTFTVSDGLTTSAPATVTVSVVAPPSVHVGDLDASAVKLSGAWRATVTIRIDSAAHSPQAGAIVSGVWSTGPSGTCTTSAGGTCAVSSGSLARKLQSARFTVTSVTLGSAAYAASSNHDPDGDSDGTRIDVRRP